MNLGDSEIAPVTVEPAAKQRVLKKGGVALIQDCFLSHQASQKNLSKIIVEKTPSALRRKSSVSTVRDRFLVRLNPFPPLHVSLMSDFARSFTPQKKK